MDTMNYNNNFIYWVIGIIVVVVLALLIYWYWQSNVLGGFPASNEQAQQEVKGNIVIAITDAAQSLQNIDSIKLSVDQIQIHSQTQGWVTVSNDLQTFDLLDLKAKGKLAVAANVDVKAGTYNQIKLTIKNVAITKTGSTTAVQSTLPKKDIIIDNNVEVSENQTTNITVDFLADKSLFTTAKAEFIFLPVVKVETRSDTTADIDSGGMVQLSGGRVESTVQSGMDVKGNMNANYTIDAASANKLEINNGLINIQGQAIQGNTDVKVNPPVELKY